MKTSSPDGDPQSLMKHLVLPVALRESSQRSALRALVAVGMEDHPEAGFHAGQALDHLTKGLLWDVRGELLTDPNKPKSIAFLSGDGHVDIKTLADISAISLPEAVSLAYAQLACGTPNETDLELVLNARNAAAQIGYGDIDQSIAAVAAMIRLSEPLLSRRGETIPEWLDDSRLTEVINAMRELPQKDVRHSSLFRQASVQSRLWDAKRAWQRLCNRIPEVHRLSAAIYPKDLPGDPEVELDTCPTTGHMALFKTEWEESEDTDDQGSDDESAVWIQWLGGVDCPLCGLSLDRWDVEELGLRKELNRETRHGY